jgi:hypothetical protein
MHRKVGAGFGLLARAAAVIAVIFGWEWVDRGPAQDYADVTVMLLLSAVVLVWAVVDGIRRPFVDAVLGWVLASALLLTLWVDQDLVGGGGIGLAGGFTLVLPAGLLVIYVGLPATVGAAVGTGVRLVAARGG